MLRFVHIECGNSRMATQRNAPQRTVSSVNVRVIVQASPIDACKLNCAEPWHSDAQTPLLRSAVDSVISCRNLFSARKLHHKTQSEARLGTKCYSTLFWWRKYYSVFSADFHVVDLLKNKKHWKMLGPFATASRRTPPVLILHCQVSLLSTPLPRWAEASYSYSAGGVRQ